MTALIRSPLVGGEAPVWASGWGQDEFGYHAEFAVWTGPMDWDRVVQRMRWIPPGTFVMGSPPDEPGRSINEVQHEVTISEGYWLADTPCRQELWEAVMPENPSQFPGPQRPVENVSYDDAHIFCDRIGQRVPGLHLQLPTEAQWEYACRAGTTSAFSFGDQVSTEQANYDGWFPLPGSPLGEYRKQTVDCQAFPPNAWGLYQMHGNVWEWCQDWWGDYDLDAVRDPEGPADGSVLVIRGGGWINGARHVRAAFRSGVHPGNRDGALGFRCLSSGKPSAEQPKAEQGSATRSEPTEEAAT